MPVTTADTGAAIPMTVMREIINTVRKRYGNLYSKVRKMSIPGGVKFPVGALQAQFRWITESTVSPRQKAGSLGDIEFSYNTAEIRVAQTFLSQLLTIEEFETKLVEIIAVAYMQAMDNGIVNGNGQGQMQRRNHDSCSDQQLDSMAQELLCETFPRIQRRRIHLPAVNG